jgi:two-component system sensor histidine kinase UhpB
MCDALYQAMKSSHSMIGKHGNYSVISSSSAATIRRAQQTSCTVVHALLKRASFLAIRGCNRQGVILHWNAASTVLYGLDAAQAVGKRLQDLLLTGDAVREFERVVACIWKTGVPMEFHWPVDLQHGRRHWVRSTMVPAFHNGEVCEIFCIDVDISEHGQKNHAPCESEEGPERIVPGDNEGAWAGDIVAHTSQRSVPYEALRGDAEHETSADPRECRNRLHPSHAERMKQMLGAELRGHADNFGAEYPMRRRRDASCRSLSRGLAMSDASGTPNGIPELDADIAQHEQTEPVSCVSEPWKAAMFNSALDPIIAMDRSGRIVEFNPAAERTFGYRASEVIGKSAVALITPADLQRKHQHVLARLSMSDNEGADRAERLELRALRADGTDFPVEVTITATDVGKVPQVIQFVRDISDRKQAEAVLQESEARLRLAAEAAEIGAWDWDAVSNVLTCSDRSRALFDLPAEARIDCALFYARVHPEDRKRVRAAACAALSARGTGEYAIDARCIRPDGTVRWVSVRGRAFFESRRGRRRPRRLIGIVRDITERKQREADLQRSNVELRYLSTHLQVAREDERARIARELHDEIGQNLTAVILHFEAMLRSEGSATAVRLDECSAIISQTLAAVRDLSLELRPPQLDTSGLTASLRWMLDRQAKASGLSIEFSLDPSLGRLPPELEITCFRVAQESVTNAVRHARATRLSVELFRFGARLNLIVRDNGRGFDVAEASSEALRGSTFGLVSMRERVHCVGGVFELKSIRDRGTEVRATFDLQALPQGT